MRGTRGRGVAVTGIGLVTPAGIGVEENWRRILSGVSTAATDPELKGERVDISCRVPGFDPTTELGRRTAWKLDRFAQLAVVGARQAVADAGLDSGSWDGTRIGVVIGNSLGGAATFEKQLRTYFDGAPEDVSALMIPMGMVNMVAGYVAMDQRIQGPSLVTATACASGASAVGTARQWLLSGLCDVVLAGGTEAAISPGTLNGLSRMGALSTRTEDPAGASRPFAHDRDGFVAGEGAAILVLERTEDAVARGARRYADIAGFSASSDAHHATAPHPQGAGLARALREALDEAGVLPDEVEHVNAHGTSTPMNDLTESRALYSVLGSGAAVTSTKGVTGHTLAAAGAVEAAYTALALHHGAVPPTANTTGLDPAIDVDIDVVTGAARQRRIQVAASTSLGFGGHNAALVLTAA
ncbi:beta-ketoacyl-[acyl-carrier-protein] synthase family protein [Streptomyces sp. A1277]|uniref:beta-ketoacyl-[acyl-carrier-protein] synthase family protein n=1 Tax=Streptomyces sp. A1277 TaxID=2563103 RepID=UPI0010A25520|nr:beta-ketoacyl-[acyl-carrier-protein] synthase family protein [Streptomyces sp. A1277]THA36617.1 beta-ketoacyl-[acyl-carrier-protein] synthase family protein [Streptomyces sp. A1277]